jgi:hypothetical protein
VKGLYSNKELIQFYFNYLVEQTICQEEKVTRFGRRKDELAKKFWERLEKMDDQIVTPVDTFRLDQITHDELVRKYIEPGIPVILKGAAKDWGAVKNWSLDYFKLHYGDVSLPFLASKGEAGAIYEEKRVEEICEEIKNGSRKYVKFSNFLLKNNKLLSDFDVSQIEKINSVKYLPSSIQLFMGGAGTKTTIHTALSNVTFVQVHGIKRWLTLPREWTPIMNPIVDRQPQFMAHDYICDVESDKIKHLTRKMPFKEVLLEPGDIYFNPAFLWHHVNNDTTSIGVAFRWISYKAIAKAPILSSLVILSQIPSILKIFDHTKGEYFPTKWP